jgi:UDP-N-acetylglucosamine 2-epimerase
LKNIDPENFQKLLKKAICAIGNSSSFIRDTTFTGTPVVLVGDRQYGREHGKNLISCEPKQNQILDSINHQLQHGRYANEGLYGDGTAAPNIVKTLENFTPYVQKTLQYPLNDEHSNH